jgi:hypothetical protein
MTVRLDEASGLIPQQFMPLDGYLQSVPHSAAPGIATDRGVGTGVSVPILEPAEELGGGVPLLGRGVAVVVKDLIDHRLERPEHGGRGRLGAGVGGGLG